MNKAMKLLQQIGLVQKKQEEALIGIELIIDQISPLEVPQGCRPHTTTSLPTCSAPKLNQKLSKLMTDNANPQAILNLYASGFSDCDEFGKVWIYNISELPFVLNGADIKNLKVPACEEDQDYAVVTSLPMVFKSPVYRVDTNTTEPVLQDGRRVAQDLINPSNLGLDQDANTEWGLALDCNYNQRGIFWSTHNPPLKKELKAAHKRLKKFYENTLELANLERITAAAKRLSISADVVRAADSYIERSER